MALFGQFVRHIAVLDHDVLFLLQAIDDGRELFFLQLLGEQGVDGVGERFDFARPGLAAAGQVFHDGGDLFVAALGGGQAQYRDFGQIFFPLHPDFEALHVLDEGIEAGVLGNDVEIGLRLLTGELADVKGDVKIEGILAVAADLDVAGLVAQFLHGFGQFIGDLGLIGAHEHQHRERMAGEQFQVFGQDVFEVDQYVVGGQGALLLFFVPFHDYTGGSRLLANIHGDAFDRDNV